MSEATLTPVTSPDYPKVTISREEVQIGDAVIPANVFNSVVSLERSSRGMDVGKLTLEIYVSGVEFIGGVATVQAPGTITLDADSLAELAGALKRQVR